MADDSTKKAVREENKLNFFDDYVESLGLEPNAQNKYVYQLRGKEGEAHAQYQVSGKAHGHDLTVVFDLGNDPDGKYNVKAYVDGDAVTAPVDGENRSSSYLGIIDPTPSLKHYLSPRGHETFKLLKGMLSQPADKTPGDKQENFPVPYHNPMRENYADACCNWLGSNAIEGTKHAAYYDTVDNVTVGIGFNMDAPNARKEWERAFANSDTKPDFDRVYAAADLPKGTKPAADQILQPDQIRLLTLEAVKLREKKLEKIYGNSWNYFSDDQKVAINSAFYSNESTVVTGHSNFKKNMEAYARATTSGEQRKQLNNAAFELAFNTKSDPNRRIYEAEKLLGIYNKAQPDDPGVRAKLEALKTDPNVIQYAQEHNITISAAASLPDDMKAALAQALDPAHKPHIASDYNNPIGRPVSGDMKLG